MLAIPDGFSRSTAHHNVRLQVLCDWIEGSLLFNSLENSISYGDVIDVLIEEHIYDEQDYASEIVGVAWAEIRRRQKIVGAGSPFNIEKNHISRVCAWKEVPAYSFCLLLSLGVWHNLQRIWQNKLGGSYAEQGELFEILTKEALKRQFPDWELCLTGWSRSSAKKLEEVVQDLIDLLHEEIGNHKIWAEPDANEAGLDLLCYRPFADGRVGIPLYLVQCATGENWPSKVESPSIKLWMKCINFAATPRKGFAIPFSLSEEEFKRKCNTVDGLLIDRYRILSASSTSRNWVSPELQSRITSWVEPRAAELPNLDR